MVLEGIVRCLHLVSNPKDNVMLTLASWLGPDLHPFFMTAVESFVCHHQAFLAISFSPSLETLLHGKLKEVAFARNLVQLR